MPQMYFPYEYSYKEVVNVMFVETVPRQKVTSKNIEEKKDY